MVQGGDLIMRYCTCSLANDFKTKTYAVQWTSGLVRFRVKEVQNFFSPCVDVLT